MGKRKQIKCKVESKTSIERLSKERRENIKTILKKLDLEEKERTKMISLK